MKLSPKIISIAKTAGGFIQQNSPTILTGMAVAGVVGTVVAAINATPKAVEIVELEKRKREHIVYYVGDEEVEMKQELTKFDIVKLTWKEYIPTAIMGTVTIGCIIGAHSISMKRTAALAGLYSLSQKALEEYESKVEEVVGKNKANKIKDEIAQDWLDKNPVDKNNIIRTGYGDTLCYDILSGRYFMSDIEKIRQAQNDFNQQLITDMSLCLNEFYGLLGLDTIGLGEEVGWSVGKLMDIRFTSKLASDGTPCLVMDYAIEPIFEYRNW